MTSFASSDWARIWNLNLVSSWMLYSKTVIASILILSVCLSLSLFSSHVFIWIFFLSFRLERNSAMFFYSLGQLLGSTCQTSSTMFCNFEGPDRWPAVHVPSSFRLVTLSQRPLKILKIKKKKDIRQKIRKE